MQFVQPKTYLVGISTLQPGLIDYLKDSNNEEFLELLDEARDNNLSDGEILCSFYAKLCYKSLTLGKNKNVSKIRGIEPNLIGCFDSGHGSVFEHCQLNFITTNCSRIFTHELVRHRVGTAFSQTSGRYVALDNIDLILDPILNDVQDDIKETIKFIENKVKLIRAKLDVENQDFAMKKKLTSAIRRIAPNGQANEIGWSVNIRQLRHILTMRVSPHAEWEINKIFSEVFDIISAKWPLMLYGMKKVECGNNLHEIVLIND